MVTHAAVPLIADPVDARAPRRSLIWGLAIAGLAAGVGSVALAASDGAPGVQVFLLVWISVPYIAAGLVAWRCRPDSRLGVLMTAGGFAVAVAALQFTEIHGLYTIGAAFDILPAVLFLHVYLAFPDGRLKSDFERLLVGAAYAVAVGLQLAKGSLGGLGPRSLLEISAQPDAARVVEQVQLVALSAVCLVAIGVLVDRRHRAGRPRRRTVRLLIDSFVIALVMIAVLFVFGAFEAPEFRTIQRTTLVLLGLSPLAFLVGLLDERLARSGVGELMIALRENLSPTALRAALAQALRDPTLTLAYWLPEFRSYVDPEGRPVEMPSPPGRGSTRIDRNGVHIATLLHDPALRDEPELLDAVGAAASIALDNGRLHAELAARLDEVRGSRARVLEAGHTERKRLERDLHDGAQQRLVALSLQLKLLEREVGDDGSARGKLESAQREVDTSLAELRALARGIHPAVLTAHGLSVALEQVSALAPVPVRLTVQVEERVPEQVEVAAYYVVTESLTNITKHAHATKVTVDVVRTTSGISVEIVDDGVGGADTERGSGLRGLADRVEALGGRLRIWTPEGGGTRVRAEIPCA
jgi:signal transduction histidine kinase